MRPVSDFDRLLPSSAASLPSPNLNARRQMWQQLANLSNMAAASYNLPQRDIFSKTGPSATCTKNLRIIIICEIWIGLVISDSTNVV